MAWIHHHLLSVLIFFPLLSGLGLAFIPRRWEGTIKKIAVLASLLTFGLSIVLLRAFSPTADFQFIEVAPWIRIWNSYYRLGIDGLSLYLVLLTTFLTPIGLLVSWRIEKRAKAFMILLLLLEASIIGAFVSLDLLLFYVFWEAMLIPMFFLVGIWGGKTRFQTAIKFFIFTMSGSLFLLIGILLIFHLSRGQLNVMDLYHIRFPLDMQYLLFALFGISFFIKIPAFPLHSWLPDTHTEAPTAGSLILAAVLLKLGIYGLMRFCLPLFPEAIVALKTPLMILSVVGIFYGSLLSWVQDDIKRLIAYSSIAHMGTIMLGIFSLNREAMVGGYFHMISHGLTTGGLFLLIGMLYERTHTREMRDYGGTARSMGVLATCFFIVTLGSIGFPGTNGFIGELLVLSGTFQVNRLLAVLGASGVVLGAVYMLRLYQKVFLGPRTALMERHKQDLSARELAVILPLIVFIIGLGIAPTAILKTAETSITPLIERVMSQLEQGAVDHGR